MGLRIRGGRRGNFSGKSTLTQCVSARGRRMSLENRPRYTNGSACTPEKMATLNRIFPSSNAIESRKQNNAVNHSILKTSGHLNAVDEEERFSKKVHLELEKTINDFDGDTQCGKSSSYVPVNDDVENEISTELEGGPPEVSINGVLRQVNRSLFDDEVGKDSRPSSGKKSWKHQSSGISRKGDFLGIEGVHSIPDGNVGFNTTNNADSYGLDFLHALEPVYFHSEENQESVPVRKTQSGPSTNGRAEKHHAKVNQGPNPCRKASMGQQKSHKYFNKLSKRNRLNFYKMNPGVARASKSKGKDVKNNSKHGIESSCGRNRKHFREKSPKNYSKPHYSTANNDVGFESCPGTSTGNQVISSGDVSTLPMILRNSVMAQNSDSEKDDEEDNIESGSTRNKNGANEVIDVIDGIEFVTFENEHDMVQFTRLVSDESGKESINDLGFSSEFPEAIIPKKTKDIKKIKGWRKKKFTVTQNPMLDPNGIGSDPPMMNDLCPDSIEYEHNYIRRQLGEKDGTDGEDEMPVLSLEGNNFSAIQNDLNKIEDNPHKNEKEDKVSAWKPSEKSAFVSFSASNSGPLVASRKVDEGGSNGESLDGFIYVMKDPKKLSTPAHSEHQSEMDHPCMTSMETLSPTSILMNKIRKKNSAMKTKVDKVSKSVQVDLSYSGEDHRGRMGYLKPRISEEQLREWSRSFQDIWDVDENRALFAASAVKPLGLLRQKYLPSGKVSGKGHAKFLKRKNLPHEVSKEPHSQRRLLRSSTKKKAPPVRLTRTSINALQSETLDTPTGPCTSISSSHRKPIDAESLDESIDSLASISGKNLSDDSFSSMNASQDSSCKNISPSSLSKVDTASTPSLDHSTDETIQNDTYTIGSSQAPASSCPIMLSSLSSVEVSEKSGSEAESIEELGSSKCTTQEWNGAKNLLNGVESRLRGRARRKLIARKIWVIRRMRKLKEMGFLGSEFNEALPRVADLGIEELNKYSYLKDLRIENGTLKTNETKSATNETVSVALPRRENVPEEKSPEANVKSNGEFKSNSVGNVRSSPLMSEKRKDEQSNRGTEYRPELENEELRVFLKPKPRPQPDVLSPMTSTLESSVLASRSSSKPEANHPFEASPPRKTEVEIIKSKSPNSPALARKKLIRELQKLNANFVSMDQGEGVAVKDNCTKEFCRLGCVCDSINTDKRLVEHCGKVECMFSCVCPSSESTAKHPAIGSDTVSRLQEESSRHMARVEKYFHHTVVEAAGELVLPGRQQRERRLPKRFLDESIIPEVNLNPKRPKTSDPCSKTAANQSSATKKLNQSTPKFKNCSVSLGQFADMQASVRCIFHSRLNCPCLKFRPHKAPRNVAMKSTTHCGKKSASLSFGSAFSVTMENFSKPVEGDRMSLASAACSSSCESSDESAHSGVISGVESIPENNLPNSVEVNGSNLVGQNNPCIRSKNSCTKKSHRKESFKESSSVAVFEESCYCRDLSNDQDRSNDGHLHSARTTGIYLWVSQLAHDRCIRRGLLRVRDMSESISLSAREDIPQLSESEPKVDERMADKEADDVPKTSEGSTETVRARAENSAPEVNVQVEEETPQVIAPVPTETGASNADLSELVRQDDSMPLFKIVEVKSLPPSSFESDPVAPTESIPTGSVKNNVRGEYGETRSSVNKHDVLKPKEKMSGLVEQKKANGRIGRTFPSLESFDLWLKSHKAMCGDLNKMCSKSLRPNPLNHVIIMRWSHLNKLVESHSAHMWLRQRFCSSSGTNSHIFITQKDQPPDSACVNFLDLERKEALCAKIVALLKAAKLGEPVALGCAILVSKGVFWEISGHIKFGKAKRNHLREILPKTVSVVTNSSSVPTNKLEAQASLRGSITGKVSNRSGGNDEQPPSEMHLLTGVSLKDSNPPAPTSADVDAPSVAAGGTTERLSAQGNSDFSESVVKVELNLETSALSVLENKPSPHLSLKPTNVEKDIGEYNFGKFSMKEIGGKLTVSGSENVYNRLGPVAFAQANGGSSKRMNSLASNHSVLNLERVPGTLSNAFLKHKQMSKVGLGIANIAVGSGLGKYSASGNMTCTPNSFMMGLFSPSLEPPPQILQFEDPETSVLSQQQPLLNLLESPEKGSRSNLRNLESKNDSFSMSNDSPYAIKTASHSSVSSENVDGIDEINFCSSSDVERKGLSGSATGSGNAFAGVKPPVLIIDLNRFRRGQTIPSNKKTPLAIRVAEIKSLNQGIDVKAMIDASDKNSPTVGINAIPQVKSPLLPKILNVNQQNPAAQEKVTTPKTSPMKYSVCKDSVVVTCSQPNISGGANDSAPKAIHVNIIKEMNPASQAKKKMSICEDENSLQVTEEEGKSNSEKSDPQLNNSGQKLELSTLKESKPLCAPEENPDISNNAFPQIGMPPELHLESDHKGNSKLSVGNLTTDLKSMPTDLKSAPTDKVSPCKSWSKEEVQRNPVNVERKELSVVSADMQDTSKMTPTSTNQAVILEDERILPKVSCNFSNLREAKNDQQLPITQNMPEVPSCSMKTKGKGDSSELGQEISHEVTKPQEGSKEIFPKTQVSGSKNQNPSMELSHVKAENMTVRTDGSTAETSSSCEEKPISLPGLVTPNSPLKIFPVTSDYVIEGEGLRIPIEFTGKQSESNAEVQKETICFSTPRPCVSKGKSKASKAKKEAVVPANHRSVQRTSKKLSSTKKTKVPHSSVAYKKGLTTVQPPQCSIPSSPLVSPATTQSPKKKSHQPAKKSTTMSPQRTFISPPKKPSTQSPKKASSLYMKKDSNHHQKDLSDCSALMTENVGAPDASKPRSPLKDAEAPTPKPVDKDSLGQHIHHSPSSSHEPDMHRTQSLKKDSTSSPKKGVARILENALVQSLKKASPSTSFKDDDVHHSPVSHSVTHSSEGQTLSPIKKDGGTSLQAVEKGKGSKVQSKQLCSPDTSTSKSQSLKKAVCPSPLSSPASFPTPSCSDHLGSQSSDLPSSSSSPAIPFSGGDLEAPSENDVIWYRLDLNGQFDKLTAEESGFNTSASRLISAVMIARTSNRTVRLAFDKKKTAEDKQDFKKGIYAVPTVSGAYVKIGPFKRNEPTGVKTFKKMGDHRYKLVPNLLKVDTDTQEAESSGPSDDSSKRNDNAAPVRGRENNDNNLVSMEGRNDNHCEGSHPECASPPADETSKVPESHNKVKLGAEKISAGQGNCGKFQDHSSVPSIIPLPLPGLSIDVIHKIRSAILETKKLVDEPKPVKRSSVANATDPTTITLSLNSDDDGKSNDVGEVSGVKEKDDGFLPVVPPAEKPAECEEVRDSSGLANEGNVSGNAVNTSDAKLDGTSNEKRSLTCDESQSQSSDASIQVKDVGLSMNVADLIGSYELRLDIEPDQESLKDSKPMNSVQSDDPPSMTETLDPAEEPRNKKMKIVAGLESSEFNTTDLEGASMKSATSYEKMDVNVAEDKNTEPPFEKLIKDKEAATSPLISENDCDIMSEDVYESGYLLPNIPKLAPLPAKKCMMSPETTAIIIEDPARSGVHVKFNGLESIISYINRLLHSHVRFFPSDMQIEWTYVKSIPSTSTSGLIELKNISRDMFITCKGIFRYKNEIEMKSLLSGSIFKPVDTKGDCEKMEKEIEVAKAELLSLVVPHDKVAHISCEAVIKKALGEISLLQGNDELLSESNVVEKKRNLELDEKLKALLKAHGVETFSAFSDKLTGENSSQEKDLVEEEPNKHPKDLRARSRSCRRGRGSRGSRKLEKPDENVPADTASSKTGDAISSDSKEVQVKDDPVVKVIGDAVPSRKGRFLRSSKSTSSPVIPPKTTDKTTPEVKQPSGSLSNAEVESGSRKESVKEKVNSASPDTIRRLVSSVVNANISNESDNNDPETKSATVSSCISKKTSGQDETTSDEREQQSVSEVKTVDASLWKRSFAQVKIDKVSLTTGGNNPSSGNAIPKRPFLRKKSDQKQRASLRYSEAAKSVSRSPATSVATRKRQS